MNLEMRSTLWGTRKIVIYSLASLIIILLFSLALLGSGYGRQKNINKAFSVTINNQTSKISNLEDYISQIEQENSQLKLQVDHQKLLISEYEDELSNAEKQDISNDVGSQSSGVFKSYTDYRCLSKNTPQWELQEKAYTDENGLRKIGDAYLVALGSYYGTEIGAKYTVTLSSGSTFDVILCDCKNDEHTDSTNRYTLSNGCMIEFYVDKNALPTKVKISGTISSIPFFVGRVISIEKNN